MGENKQKQSEIAHYKGISFFYFRDLSKAQWSSSYNTICLFTKFPSDKKKKKEQKKKKCQWRMETKIWQRRQDCTSNPCVFGMDLYWATNYKPGHAQKQRYKRHRKHLENTEDIPYASQIWRFQVRLLFILFRKKKKSHKCSSFVGVQIVIFNCFVSFST